jgi:colicin import membrane protein
MRVDWAISATAHAGLLAVGLVSFSATPLKAPPESVPVDIISATEYSKVTAGSKTAPQAEAPKPLVEKVAEKKIADDPTPKISEKQEIKEAKVEPPPPLPEPRPKPPQPEAAKPEPQKVDPIAEALKKDQAKRREEARKEQQKQKQQQKQQEKPQFDAAKVAALLDKRAPQRHASAGDVINNTASLGRASGTAAQLSQNEIDALRRRIGECWNVPAGAEGIHKLSVVFRVMFRPDGTVSHGPEVVEATASPFGPAFAESGKRAILRCQPYTMLRRETYDSWKDLEVQFTPSDMFGG